MRRLMTGIAALACGSLAMTAGCATTGTNARATVPTAAPAALSPAAMVRLGDVTAAAQAAQVAYVLFVDRHPTHCDGALCLKIVNNHRAPALFTTINGQAVTVVGPVGPLLPPGSSGYVRLVNPGVLEISYELYDSMRLGDNGRRMPVATVLSRCHVTARVGGALDAHWGGHVTRLSSSFCRD